jgi:putative transposase
LDKPCKFTSRTCTLNYQRDYSFKTDNRVSIVTLTGRIVVGYSGYNKHTDWIKNGAKISKKQRKANRNKAKWSFAELHSFIDYKAVLNNSLAIKVPAHYTSQMCPRCGHVSKENRPNKGLNFDCKCCGYKLHADLVGARNVALRSLLVRQDWASTGILSASPDVSNDEAKAKNLQRFLELRWSSDASPDRAR